MGVQGHYSYQKARNITLTNQLALACGLVGVIIVGSFILVLGWYINFTRPVIILISLLTGVVLWLNKLHRHNAARMMLCLLIPLSLPALAIGNKLFFPQYVSFADFIGYRFFLVMGCVVPITVFSMSELKPLSASVAINFMMLLLFDAFHKLAGVSLSSMGFQDPQYAVYTIVSVVAFATLCVVLLFFKYVNEQMHQRNEELIEQLNLNNESLSQKVLTTNKVAYNLQLELAQVTDQVKTNARQQASIASDVSNQLSSPATTILKLAKQLVNTHGPVEELAQIEAAASALQQFAEGLGALSAAGRQSITPVPISYYELANKAWKQATDSLANRATVDINLENTVPGMMADPLLTTTALQHLFTYLLAQPGAEANRVITVGYNQARHCLTLVNRNQEAAIAHTTVFNPFAQSTSIAVQASVGAAIAKQLIELQKGSIELNKEGNGFNITLPQV